MSNIAVAKKQLAQGRTGQAPGRLRHHRPRARHPGALGKWLKAQDTDFIGLTGDFDTIQAGARALGISIEPAKKEKAARSSRCTAPRSSRSRRRPTPAYVLYGEDTTADDYTKDLPKIVRGGLREPPHSSPARSPWRSPALALAGCSSGGGPAEPELKVAGAFMPQPAMADMAGRFLHRQEQRAAADKLTSVTSDLADDVTMHRRRATTMGAGKSFDVPAGRRARLRARRQPPHARGASSTSRSRARRSP